MKRTLVVALALGSSTCMRPEPVEAQPAERRAADPKAEGGSQPLPTAAEPFARDDKAGVKAALRDAGIELGDDPCIAWPSSFPRVVVVGGFASDRGCDVEGIFVDRTFVAKAGEIAGLATRGFATAGMVAKETLARAWTDEVVHAFGGHFVTASETAFTLPDSPEFAPVMVRANKVGGVVVEGWVREPSGMQDESTFHLVSYRFAPDGRLEVEAKSNFTVDGERLRGRERAPGKAGG